MLVIKRLSGNPLHTSICMQTEEFCRKKNGKLQNEGISSLGHCFLHWQNRAYFKHKSLPWSGNPQRFLMRLNWSHSSHSPLAKNMCPTGLCTNSMSSRRECTILWEVRPFQRNTGNNENSKKKRNYFSTIIAATCKSTYIIQ